MGWKKVEFDGFGNVNSNADFLKAIEKARQYLLDLGLPRPCVEKMLKEEKEHFAFLQGEITRGATTHLCARFDQAGQRVGLFVGINGCHTRSTVKKALFEIGEHGPEDTRLKQRNNFSRFRRG
jgi:hypothetical protein